ncbi:MAG: PEGA domain-containing protein [Planctomycetota bacterium]
MLRIITTCVCAIVAAASFTGCGKAREWQGAPADTPARDVVLFAPLDVGPLAEVYPEARIEYARDLAKSLGYRMERIEAYVGTALPASSDPRWDQGMIGEARGAGLVVLTEVVGIEEQEAVGGGGKLIATLSMRGIDATGKVAFAQEPVASYSLAPNPKVGLAPSGQPMSRAVWAACGKGLTALQRYLETENLAGRPDPAADDPPEQHVLVDVKIDSTPSNADIFVDGTFRGNTPTTVPLPVRAITLRIERQGYQPWEQELTPRSDMHLAPALEPLPGDTPAE